MTFLRSHKWCIVEILPKRPCPQTLSYTLHMLILPALCIIVTKRTGTCLFPEPVCLPQLPDNFFVFGNSSDVSHCPSPVLLFAVNMAALPAVQGVLCEACCPVCLRAAWQPFMLNPARLLFFHLTELGVAF